MLVWSSSSGAGGRDIFGQRYNGMGGKQGGEFQINLHTLTDGLLILRFLFGFTEGTLINGAIDLGECDRCDAGAVTPYLETLD